MDNYFYEERMNCKDKLSTLFQTCTLFDYAKHVCFTNPKVLFSTDDKGVISGLRPEVCLPSLITDELISYIAQDGRIDDTFLNLLSDTEKFSLKHAGLHGCDSITDGGLQKLFKHNLQSLDLSDCCLVTTKTMEYLSQCKDSLQHLNIDFCKGVITRGVMMNFPFTNLATLSVNSVQLVNFETHLVEQFFGQLKNLTSLDLSNQIQVHSTKSLDFLNLIAKQLKSLVLYNCKPKLITDSWDIICSMSSLKLLDISQEPSGMAFGHIRVHTNIVTPQMLSRLMDSIPSLISLDISRYNLGSWDDELADKGDSQVYIKSSIPGLRRLKQPLSFLGMWMTRWTAESQSYDDIENGMRSKVVVPALRVAGGVSKEALLTALEVYTARRRRFLKVLSLFQKHPSLLEDEDTMVKVMQCIFKAMTYHALNSDLQIQCTEMLSIIVSKCAINSPNFPTGKLYREMVQAILCTAVRSHCGHSVEDSICELLFLLKPWRSEFEFISIFKTVLRFATESDTADIRVQIELLKLMITEAPSAKRLELVNNDCIKDTLAMMHKSIITFDDSCLYQNFIHEEMTELLSAGWLILGKLTSFQDGRARFMSAGGVSVFKTCCKRLPDNGERRAGNSIIQGDDTVVVPWIITPDVISEMVSVIGNLVLDSNCQPKMGDVVDPLFSLATTAELPGLICHILVAFSFCILAAEAPYLWKKDSQRLSMIKKVVEANHIRLEIIKDVEFLKDIVLSGGETGVGGLVQFGYY
ncbi:protein zer-1 homolog [Glandiceps talaboti]